MEAAALSDRDLWLAERRQGLGGTDAAAIVGVSKWATSYDVYLDKMGLAPPKEDTPQMWFGRELEDIIARRYTEETGRRVWSPKQSFVHPKWSCLRVSPDRLVIGERRGMEVKTASVYTADEWGPAGTDLIPDAYTVQCAHNMAVMDLDVWDVALLLGGSDYRTYTLHRDREFEALLVERCVRWWATHIIPNQPPAITDAESTSDLLARRFPRDVGTYIDADDMAVQWLRQFVNARAEVARAEVYVEEAKNNLKAFLGEASGFKLPSGESVTWKSSREVESVDWRGAALALRERAERAGVECADIMSEATTRKAGARRFLYHPPKERGAH